MIVYTFTRRMRCLTPWPYFSLSRTQSRSKIWILDFTYNQMCISMDVDPVYLLGVFVSILRKISPIGAWVCRSIICLKFRELLFGLLGVGLAWWLLNQDWPNGSFFVCFPVFDFYNLQWSFFNSYLASESLLIQRRQGWWW